MLLRAYGRASPEERRGFRVALTICVLSVVDLGLTNVAISLLDPALQQCLSALAPVFTFVAESLLGCELKQPLGILLQNLLMGYVS